MPESNPVIVEPSHWPHRLAVALCCATFPLVWIGGLVTTYKAGMAFPDWPTSDGYFLFFYPWLDWLRGPWDMFVEHGHRMYAAAIGMLTIGFCVSLWTTRQPAWLRWLGAAALVGVIFQGVLGGMRVILDAQTVAKLHGCVGPAFFALTAVLATVTSKRWLTGRRTIHAGSAPTVAVMSVATAVLAMFQLMLGAQVRHYPVDGAPSGYRVFLLFHIVVGVVLALHILMAAFTFWWKTRGESRSLAGPLLRPAMLLVVLIGLQITLGAATWIYKYNWPAFVPETIATGEFTVRAHDWRQAQITTAHVAIGSLILAVSTMLAVRTIRMARFDRPALQPQPTWKGAVA